MSESVKRNISEESVIRNPGIYEKYIKRIMDFVLSLAALIVLSPVILIFTIIGIFAMGGNPFFTPERPGKLFVF